MELSDRFDAWLQDLDVPASEGKLARLDRENRRIRRGRPAKKKPSALRAQALYAKGLAKPFAHNVAPLTGLRSATAPDVGTLGAHPSAPRLLPKRKRNARLPELEGAEARPPGGSTLPARSFPLGGPTGADACARLQRQLAEAASMEHSGDPHLGPGYAVWGLVPDGVAARAPPTLAVVCNPPTLVWRDGRERAGGPSLVARSWAWGADADGHRGWLGLGDDEKRAIEQRLLGARLAAPRSLGDEEADEDGRRRSAARRGLHRRPLVGLDGAPVVVLKFADGGENGSVGMEARAAGDRVEAEAHPATFDGHRRRGSTTGHACAFYRSPLAARCALKALFDVEPHGDDARGKYGVALQAYVKPKGPSAWMVRAVVDAGGGGGGSAWFDADLAYRPVEARWGALSPPTPVVADANHSAVSLAWPPNDAATYFWAERYHVEMAEGDVGGFKLVAVRAAADGGVDVAGLDSDAAYRFRLRGANQTATSPPGEAVACRTLPHPRDEWVRVHPSVAAFSDGGYGAASPVLGRPHYSMGAQTGLGADDAASESAAGRAADAPTEFYPSAPSGRQGHSLTRLGGAPEIRAYRLPSAELGAVFLFGGHGDGYECDGAVGATFRLGAYRWRGFDNERCVRRMGASDELWRLDAGLLEWELIRPGRNASWPPPRSRHVAAAVGGFVAVFGGVKEPDPRYVEDGDLEFAYYRDLWLLDVGAPRRATWSWTAGSAVDPVFVPDARTTYFDVNVTAGDEWCLRDVDIYVRISHPCASQLSISVVGPGPVSGDGNFRDPVAASWPVLLHAPDANSEACDRLDPPFSTQDALNDFGYKGDPGMLFDDDAPVDVRAPDAKNPYGGTFRPVDALAEFEGARPSGTWTLVVTDHSGGLRKNYNAANLTAFRVVSRLERCERRYVWRNVTNATGDAPPALAGALGVSTGDSLFVYGGRTASDPFPDKALWRYDILTNAWTALSAAPQPEGVYDPVGKAAVITPWGIYAFGGLGGWHDERGLPCSQFDGRVLWLDMLSNRWWGLDDEVWPGPHEIEVDPGRHRVDGASVVAATVEAVNDRPAPRGRYYASLAYLEPGVADVVSAAADVRAGLLPDTDAAVPPAILLFGGDDDFSDLDDAWLLKLGNASLRHTSDPRFEFHLSPSFHFAFCGWRFQGKSQELWDASCGANATTSPMEDCEFVEVLQRAYCEHQYQSLNHLPY